MSIIAIVGSAIASTLLSKVFSKATETKDQPAPDKNVFQLMVEQFSPAEKAQDASKTAVACSGTPDGGVGGKVVKPESATGAAALDGQFTQSRINRPSAESAGYSKQDLSFMIGHIGESDFQRTNLMQSVVDHFAAVDTDGNGKISDSEVKAYESVGLGSASASHSRLAGNEAGTRLDKKGSLEELLGSLEAREASASSVAGILQRASQLRASYGVEATQAASGKSISTAV